MPPGGIAAKCPRLSSCGGIKRKKKKEKEGEEDG